MNINKMEYLKKYIETSDIILRPDELTHIELNIEKKIRKKIGMCSKEKGYIIMINNIQKKIQNIISRVSGNCKFKVSYNIYTLKPENDHIYNVLVSNIFKEGIFCEYNRIKILIPVSCLTQYVFENKTFINDNKHIIQTGDWIKVQITNVRYDDQNYQCIAKLV